MARSHEARDQPTVGYHSLNRGRCLDCHQPTRHPELCWPCMQALAGEGR